jgi:hypothetical protein
MKFAKKFMVVPFVKVLENPDEKYLIDIDNVMSKILRQENLSIDQKLKLYNRALDKFTQQYDPNLFGNSAISLNKLVKPVGELVKKTLEQNQGQITDNLQTLLNQFAINTRPNDSPSSNHSHTTNSNDSIHSNTSHHSVNSDNNPNITKDLSEISDLSNLHTNLPISQMPLPKNSSSSDNSIYHSDLSTSPISINSSRVTFDDELPTTSIKNNSVTAGKNDKNITQSKLRSNTSDNINRSKSALSYDYRTDNLNTLGLVDLDSRIKVNKKRNPSLDQTVTQNILYKPKRLTSKSKGLTDTNPINRQQKGSLLQTKWINNSSRFFK